MPRQRRNINRQNAVLDGANVPAEPTDYSTMSTEALRLMLGERHLEQTGNLRELISRLQQNEQQRPPASQSASAPSNSSSASGVPHAELAALIASIVDERMNHQVIQDGGASNASAQLARPSPPSNLQDSLRSSPPHRHKMAPKTQPVNSNLPFKIFHHAISSQTPAFLLVLVPSLLLSTFPIPPN